MLPFITKLRCGSSLRQCLLVCLLACGVSGDPFDQAIQADEVVENFIVGDPFFFGLPGANPGDHSTTFNQFSSSLPRQGSVRVINPFRLSAGLGSVRFQTSLSNSRVDIDLGNNIELINIPNAVVQSTAFHLLDMDSDADADRFTFEVTARFQNSAPVTAIEQLAINIEGGSYSVTSPNESLFRFEIFNSGPSPSSISLSSATGDLLQAVDFRQISSDVANDEVIVRATRSYLTVVPEPSSAILLSLGISVFALTRVRRVSE